MSRLLEVTGLVAGYGGVPVLHGVDLTIDEGELVTVIGANGAGKSTLLRTLSGVNDVMDGTISYRSEDIAKRRSPWVARSGIVQVPENRRVFPKHSVEDNLVLGSYCRKPRNGWSEDLESVYRRFPLLRERRSQKAGTLSGGQQQMLAIGMGLMARPKLLMLDEPSLGLAPLIVDEMFAEIARLREQGTTILLVEQLAERALEVADRGVVLHLGRVGLSGPSSDLMGNQAVRDAYLGAWTGA